MSTYSVVGQNSFCSTPSLSKRWLRVAEQESRFFLVGAQEALRHLATLQPDWDGAGSPMPMPGAIANASARLPELYRVISLAGSWRMPHVSASESGEVTFEWWSGNKKLTLYFDELHMEVIRVWGANINDEMKVIPLPHPTYFFDSWEWLNAH